MKFCIQDTSVYPVVSWLRGCSSNESKVFRNSFAAVIQQRREHRHPELYKNSRTPSELDTPGAGNNPIYSPSSSRKAPSEDPAIIRQFGVVGSATRIGSRPSSASSAGRQGARPPTLPIETNESSATATAAVMSRNNRPSSPATPVTHLDLKSRLQVAAHSAGSRSSSRPGSAKMSSSRSQFSSSPIVTNRSSFTASEASDLNTRHVLQQMAYEKPRERSFSTTSYIKDFRSFEHVPKELLVSEVFSRAHPASRGHARSPFAMAPDRPTSATSSYGETFCRIPTSPASKVEKDVKIDMSLANCRRFVTPEMLQYCKMFLEKASQNQRMRFLAVTSSVFEAVNDSVEQIGSRKVDINKLDLTGIEVMSNYDDDSSVMSESFTVLPSTPGRQHPKPARGSRRHADKDHTVAWMKSLRQEDQL